MSFPRYPNYKDGGFAWLGEVPMHWEVKKLKYVSPELTVGIVVEPSRFYAEEGVPALRSLNVKSGAISLDNLVFITPGGHEIHSKSKLRAGDIVAVRSGQPGTSAIIPRELDGCNCIDLIIIRRPIISSERFLCWYLGSAPALIQFSIGSGGAIQQHFNISTAAELIVAVPSLAEQNAIAAFLDREIAKIDALVAEQQRMIELLTEKRKAVISHAVTKGLNPYVPMKDSGVEWLGGVPAHWDLVKLGLLGVFKGGAGFPDQYQGQTDLKIPFFKVADISQADADGALRTANHTISSDTAQFLRARVFPASTIVFAKVGAALFLQRYRWLGQPSCIDNNMMGLIVNERCVPRFLLYVLPLLDMSLIANPGAVPSLNEEQISSQRVVLPPQAEQVAIVDELDRETARVDALIAEAQRAIELLQERRAALTSAAVTGQIDVRAIADRAAA